MRKDWEIILPNNVIQNAQNCLPGAADIAEKRALKKVMLFVLNNQNSAKSKC
jgi:hypothetical protein